MKGFDTMQVVTAITPEHFHNIYTLYLTAFPENERKSFKLMQDLVVKGLVEIVVFKTEDLPFVGFAISAINNQTVLIDYLAINPEFRGKGYGSQALGWLLENYSKNKVCLEIESTNIESENARERFFRKAFYLKNNLNVLPFEAEVFKVRFEILANDTSISPQDFVAIYHHVYGSNSSKNVVIFDENS